MRNLIEIAKYDISFTYYYYYRVIITHTLRVVTGNRFM